MALMLRSSRMKSNYIYSLRRFCHAIAQPAPLDRAVNYPTASSPSLVLPEYDNNYNSNNNNIGFMLPNSPLFGGSMELMAVPKKKVSPHKRGIRNGPKALKPVPVIMRCKCEFYCHHDVYLGPQVCGRVKLPHFFCCSGIKPGDENSSNS